MNYKNKVLKNLTAAIMLMVSIPGFSQEKFEMWVKLSPEIRVNFENSPWEIRWRPDDQIFLPERYNDFLPKNTIARTDVMIGYNFKNVKLFSYSKFDEFGAIWTGLRLDYNLYLFQKKVLANIQERLFLGLNGKADNHYYLIQYITYNGSEKVQPGILSYGKFEFNWPYNKTDEKIPFKDNHWFIGPSINFELPLHFSFNAAFTKSIFYNNTYMCYLKLGYKIKIKQKKRVEDSE